MANPVTGKSKNPKGGTIPGSSSSKVHLAITSATPPVMTAQRFEQTKQMTSTTTCFKRVIIAPR